MKLEEISLGNINLPEDKKLFLLETITKDISTPLAISYGAVRRLFVNDGHLHYPH